MFEDESVVELLDGHAEVMGDGIFIVVQADERGAVQTVVLSKQDLAKMLGVQLANDQVMYCMAA